MYVTLVQFIGQQGNAFERIGLAFQAYGFTPPSPDTITGGEATGGYVSNIVKQYQADLTEGETIAIIEFGLTHAQGDLEYYRKDPGSLLYTAQELAMNYQDRLERKGTRYM